MKKKREEEEEQEEEEEEEKPKKKIGWDVRLVITNENEPPKKVLVKGEETLDDWGFRAKVLNELEKINKALLE